MNLKDLREKVKKRMSKEQKKKLISELRKEIIKICPWPRDPLRDIQIGLRLKKILEESNQEAREQGEAIPFPEDYGKNEEIQENLTKKELLESLGSQIMQELYHFWPRLATLNADVEYRKENQQAREKGLVEPYPGLDAIEPNAAKFERCFGILQVMRKCD